MRKSVYAIVFLVAVILGALMFGLLWILIIN